MRGPRESFGGNDVPTEPGFVPVAALCRCGLRLRPRTMDCLPPERWAAQRGAQELEKHQAHEVARRAALIRMGRRSLRMQVKEAEGSDDFAVFLWSLLKVAVVTVVMLLGVAYTVLLERKLVGRIQNRWGPSRVGPFGLLQPLVDGAKSFLKEDIIPHRRLPPLYLLAPILALGCALISIGVVPFGEPN
jgi:hypothetical protein